MKGEGIVVMKKGTKSITIRLPGERKFEIERMALEENRSVNNFVINAVEEYIKYIKTQKNKG